MKRFACAALIATMTATAPALALPNAFWTFGWAFPGRAKPWTIGRTRDRGDLRLAALNRAERAPLAALAVPQAALATIAVIEPNPVALAVAEVAAMPTEPALPRIQLADVTPARLLAYDVAGL